MTNLKFIGILLFFFSSLLQAESFILPNDMNLDVNGYVGYKYIYSSQKNTAIRSSPELGVSLALQANEHLSLYTQFAYTENIDSALVYSFAAFDWQFDNGIRTSVKAGKLRENYALYNTTRINPRTRQGVIPPQAIYWDSLSALLTSGVGISTSVGYKNVEAGFTIDKPVSIDAKQEAQTWTSGLANKVHVEFGSRKSAYLQYFDDEIPLKIKLSWFEMNFGNDNSPAMKFLFPQYYSKDQIADIFLAGVEYSPTDKLTLIGESIFVKGFFNKYSKIQNWSNGYSLTAKYDLNEYVTLYSNYNYYNSQPVSKLVVSPWQYQHTSDINVGLNYHHQNWQVGIEGHYIQGGRWTMPNDFKSNPDGYKNWTMIGINFTYFF